MKRVAILVVMALMSLSVSARSAHYFTHSQALRTVSYLNSQNELMIYCGYEYEIPTYILLNEVWMERVNSSYYELWIFGYDAYTGDEIYMPIDLECIWLYSGTQIYNAAQYLRFRTSVNRPSLTWYIPPYHPYTRITHRRGYTRSYHYNIHRYGWMPPAHHHGATPPLPYYYMRHPSTPAPMPTARWTPGSDKPTVVKPTPSRGDAPRVNSGSHNTGTTRSTGVATPTTPSTSSRSTGTTTSSSNTSSRSTGTTTSNSSTSSRSTGTTTSSSSTSSRSTGTTTSSSSTTSRSTGTTPTRATATERSTSTGSESGTSTRSTGTSTRSTGTTTRSSSSTPTTRSSSTSTRSANTERRAESGERKVESSRSTGSTSTRGTGSTSRTTGTR